jgi:hypothetical protein
MDIYTAMAKPINANLAIFMLEVKIILYATAAYLFSTKRKVLNPRPWNAKLTYNRPTLWKNKGIICHQLSVTNPD